jgi:hypothetical protein
MAAVQATVGTSANSQGDRGALVEERQEAAINAAAVRIQCECALTYMNASSGQNLSDVLMANLRVAHTKVERRGALDSVTDTTQLRRTNVTCIWGVSDPRKLGAGP